MFFSFVSYYTPIAKSASSLLVIIGLLGGGRRDSIKY
jgi:hypothetical protein